MTLVDTSVWVDHLRRGNTKLAELLELGQVVQHPFVIGELACGNLVRRAEILDLLEALPPAETADHEEAMRFLDVHKLHGTGLGWIDLHLIVAARLTGTSLWTLDNRLKRAASTVGVASVS